MVFTRRKTQPRDVRIEIDNEIISETNFSKFLGCILITSLIGKYMLIMSQGNLQGE